jgi:hypothetical protein
LVEEDLFMKKRWIKWIIAVGIIFFSANLVAAQEMGIITGGPKGTYYHLN